MATFHFRIGGTGTILSESDQEDNVIAIRDVLQGQYGWTLEAIAGVLGCFQAESAMNPGIYETSHGGNLNNLPYFPGGMGLAQWTDYPAYTSEYPNPLPWSADKEGKNWWDGNFQCWLLTKAADDNYTSMGYGQGPRWGWQMSSSYPSISFSEYQKFSGDTDQATEYWFYDFEWHSSSVPSGYLETRKEAAKKWYEFLGGHPVRKGMPLWMFLRKF
mgnify:CR=1 FL=1